MFDWSKAEIRVPPAACALPALDPTNGPVRVMWIPGSRKNWAHAMNEVLANPTRMPAWVPGVAQNAESPAQPGPDGAVIQGCG